MLLHVSIPPKQFLHMLWKVSSILLLLLIIKHQWHYSKIISLKLFQWLILMGLFMVILVVISVVQISIENGQEILINMFIQLLQLFVQFLIDWKCKNISLTILLICMDIVDLWVHFFMDVVHLISYNIRNLHGLWQNLTLNLYLIIVPLDWVPIRDKQLEV